jgi:hypothetical protein
LGLAEVIPLHATERACVLGGLVFGTALLHRKCVCRIGVNGDGEEKRTAEYRNLTKNHWFKFPEPAHHPEPIIPESDALFGSKRRKKHTKTSCRTPTRNFIGAST